MNILISPAGNVDTKEVFKYARFLTQVMAKVSEKDPNAPKMHLCLDNFSCIHCYVRQNDNENMIRCTKCGDTKLIREVPNAKGVKETAGA